MPPSSVKLELHPRNRNRGRYDFPALIQAHPGLERFVARNAYGDESIDFANPEAVKTLNQAILIKDYGVKSWDVPQGYLCPPIPGRADYLHLIADLLAHCHDGEIPRGREIRALDIGCGANLIYPLIGQAEYGWSFVGTDIDSKALESAKQVLEANPQASALVELRLQKDPYRIFDGVVKPGESFDITLCNPPFHASEAEAQAGSRRKWRGLGKEPKSSKGAPVLNFGGQGTELWCEGGERAFILQMIRESETIQEQVGWFTTLVSKGENAPAYLSALDAARVREYAVLEMAQGQKKSRILAWTYREWRSS